MKNISDELTVFFDNPLLNKPTMSVIRRNEDLSIMTLKKESGEQANILYHILTEQFTKAEIRAKSEGNKMEKEVYIVSDLDNVCQRAIKLTEEQAKAIEWFIETENIDYYIQKANEVKEEIE
jgi:hypothetical protein